MPYLIRAERTDQVMEQTRCKAASAVVLAMKWIDQGYHNVTITTAGGRSFDVRSAQQRLVHGLRL